MGMRKLSLVSVLNSGTGFRWVPIRDGPETHSNVRAFSTRRDAKSWSSKAFESPGKRVSATGFNLTDRQAGRQTTGIGVSHAIKPAGEP